MTSDDEIPRDSSSVSASLEAGGRAEERAPDDIAPRLYPATAPGGWTGFWVVAWAAAVGLPAAALAAVLFLAPPTLESARLTLERFAMDQGVPPDVIDEPAAVIADALLGMVVETRPWGLAVTVICLILIVSGMRLTVGAEMGRKTSRAMLGALLAVTVLAGAYVSLSVIPGFLLESDALRTAIVELARRTGEPVQSKMLDTLLDASTLRIAAWTPCLLITAPTVLLWWATGRRTLRAWCAPAA